MRVPCLKEFIVKVPICRPTTPLASLWQIFHQNQCASLIVVNEAQQPKGVLHLNSLLPYLIASATPGWRDSSPPTTSASAPYWQQPLSQLGLSIVQPVSTLPGNLTIEQWLQQRDKTDNNPHWAIIDAGGKFLGLLDSPRLMQLMLADSLEASSAPKLPKNGNSLAQSASLTLIQLLERLPLPIMLQTNSGQVLRQNIAWQQHFGSLQDPEQIGRDAAALLETIPIQNQLQTPEVERLHHSTHQVLTPNHRADTSLQFANPSEIKVASAASKKKEKGKTKPTSRPHNAKTGVSFELVTPPGVWSKPVGDERDLEDLGESSLPNTSDRTPPPEDDKKAISGRSNMCQRGQNSDTCVCICPMENDSDRIWQFVKVPLGNILSGLEAKENSTKAPFRLANFKASVRVDSEAFLPATGLEDLWLLLASDVTEQQQVAKELEAKNADLIQLNRLKDEFLACISHELKTPLTAVLGLSSLLKDRLLGELNNRQARYAQLIHQSGRHLMAVVNDILDLTRIETGQMELMLSPVDIRTICLSAKEQAGQLQLIQNNSAQQETDIGVEPRFTLEIEPGLDSLIADEMRLRQMLVNLLSNALKFTPPDGSIGLRVSSWEGFVAFCVWDTGIGIPEEKQHLIFQKFQQLESPLTRQFQGTGLGLVLTQRLARLHGGDVSFISYFGAGSQFTLLLPPCPPIKALEQGRLGVENNRPMLNPQCPISQSKLVLIVEGASRLIEDLTEKLTKLGYRVAIARSGTEALEKARALQPLAILINPLLPLLSGWDVLTLLKSNPQTSHIPAIVTATMVEKKLALSNRADDFLSLPVELNALQHSLEQLTRPAAENQGQNATKLTILYLMECDRSDTGDTDLSQLLHRHHYRVLEADDLDQAEILARIWQPRVVLIDRGIASPLNYLQQLSQYPALAILPLVTLEDAIASAANLVKGLSVFPCLEPPGSPHESSALLQAIQVAAGTSWKPNILVVNISTLTDLQTVATQEENRSKKRSEWEKALIQYLQTAGFKGVIARTWDEVLRQIQHRSIDLLLVELESISHPFAIKVFDGLKQVPSRPPTLVLERRAKIESVEYNADATQELVSASHLVQEVADAILPAEVSMKELLAQISQVVGIGE